MTNGRPEGHASLQIAKECDLKEFDTLEIFSDEVETEFYRRRYPECANLTDLEVIEHYHSVGKQLGKLAAPHAVREHFVIALAGFDSSLEIGPFFKPVLSGSGVKYFDVLDTEQLRQRAREVGGNEATVPNIDYVSPSGDLTIVKEVFDLVFSSHAIEHQPDLIGHLQSVEQLLKPSGVYGMIVPDCRFCFDHFLPPSHIGSVLQAREELRTRHGLSSVVEHRALTTHNDAVRHWRGDHVGTSASKIDRIRNAIAEYRRANGGYVDVHAWQFTPQNFAEIMQILFDLGATKLKPARVYETPFGRFEFCAVLEQGVQEHP